MIDFRPLEYRYEDVLFRGGMIAPFAQGRHPAVLIMHDALGACLTRKPQAQDRSS